MERQERIVVDAVCFRMNGSNGDRVVLAKKDGKWMAKSEKSIANIGEFTEGNPLIALLTGKSDGFVFEIDNTSKTQTDSPQFDFDGDDRKIFVIDPHEQNPYAIPFEMAENDFKIPQETKEYTLDDLYQMAEKIAVDE